jgi:hypothetical protein
MAHVIYEIVEHDGGWAYRVDGVLSEIFQATTRPAALLSARPPNSASLEIRPAFRTKTRTGAFALSCRTAAIDRLLR